MTISWRLSASRFGLGTLQGDVAGAVRFDSITPSLLARYSTAPALFRQWQNKE